MKDQTTVLNNDEHLLLKDPVLLSVDNFTPLRRTPWAGEDIFYRYKNKIVSSRVEKRIGESWEFSCDPSFPSKIKDTDTLLVDFIKRHHTQVLGSRIKSCDILVKILHATEALSLQVHPDDEYSGLKANECGKPESWLVLESDSEAGLYIGFSRAIKKSELHEKLRSCEDISDLLQFVRVFKGDYFEIPANTPHAIGAGVVVFEPQKVIACKEAKTYRLWDWGRKYDANSSKDPINGTHRELHIDEGLEILNTEKSFGASYVAKLRKKPKVYTVNEDVKVSEYPANEHYQVFWIRMGADSDCTVNVKDAYGVCIVIKGTVVSDNNKEITLPTGQTALFPNSALPVALHAKSDSEFILTVPSQANVAVKA